MHKQGASDVCWGRPQRIADPCAPNTDQGQALAAAEFDYPHT
ncbi:MAG: hypothetical protein WBQ55_11985 [Xanthobacteraceae bacterium]